MKGVIKILCAVLMLFGISSIGNSLRAEPANGCKVCQEQHRACVQAHSRAACSNEYEICMKHCRRK